MIIRQPLQITGTIGKYDVKANVLGGGLSGQAGALRHGIARALVVVDSDLKSKLKKEGLMTRDPREVERKKFGQKGAKSEIPILEKVIIRRIGRIGHIGCIKRPVSERAFFCDLGF